MDYDRFKYCGLNVALNVLSGKWKPVILFHLFHEDEVRFTELWRNIPKVAKKVLLEHLKQMEEDGVVIRKEKNTFPPEVYYKISEKGKALGPALAALESWARKHAAEDVAAMRAAKRVAL